MQMRINAISMLIILAIITLCVTTAQAAQICVKPTYLETFNGDNITVEITVDPEESSIYNVSYTLNFDNTLLNATSQAPGGFLSQDGESTNLFVNEIDNDSGKIEYVESRMDTLIGVNESGVLATIIFEVIGDSAVTQLNLSDNLLYSTTGQVTATINNGRVGIAQALSPYHIHGYVSYENSSDCTNPVVNITNNNIGMKWTTKTIETSNYYQIVLNSSADIIAGETLQFNARSPDGSQLIITEHSVTQDEIDNGGIFNFNLTLVSLDTTAPAINSVTLDPNDPNAGDNITVTVNATDNDEIESVIANNVSLSNADGDDIWEGTITAIAGTHTVNVSASDTAGNIVYDETASYTAPVPDDTTYPVINSVVLDPNNPNAGDNITVTVNATDNDEIESVIANNVSLSNADGDDIWEGNITAIAGTHTVNVSASDTDGNIVYDETASYTAPVPDDTTYPVINSVVLDPNNPNAGDNITVTVNATDNDEIESVIANNVSLSNA
ncbi:MAG TPA: hypothetical protein C5S50_01620, partial [Methanosarcinaceae archaeon]|nr:hypothetical protein [Methanosarcinaceae archaeon]